MSAAIRLAARAGRLTLGGLHALRRHWRERRIAAALDALSDAALKDLGLSRGAIPHVARNRAKGLSGE